MFGCDEQKANDDDWLANAFAVFAVSAIGVAAAKSANFDLGEVDIVDAVLVLEVATVGAVAAILVLEAVWAAEHFPFPSGAVVLGWLAIHPLCMCYVSL